MSNPATVRAHMHKVAMLTAEKILGEGRKRDGRAFADLVVGHSTRVDEAFSEFAALDLEQLGMPEYYAALEKVVTAAKTSVAAIAAESLRLAIRGSERGRMQ